MVIWLVSYVKLYVHGGRGTHKRGGRRGGGLAACAALELHTAQSRQGGRNTNAMLRQTRSHQRIWQAWLGCGCGLTVSARPCLALHSRGAWLATSGSSLPAPPPPALGVVLATPSAAASSPALHAILYANRRGGCGRGRTLTCSVTQKCRTAALEPSGPARWEDRRPSFYRPAATVFSPYL